ncbi:MAG: dienelactone hydrolase family protein [Acidobacteriota bacterium]
MRYRAFLPAILTSISLVPLARAGEMVSYKSGSDEVKGYLALPAGKGPFPAVVVIPEWWGLNDWVKGNCDEMAKKGYVALGVDIYRGKSTSNPDEAHELMRGLPDDRAARDLQAAFDQLSGRADVKKDRIGSIGWCMGGGLSLTLATQEPRLAACVINYGHIVTEPATIAKIKAPLLGIFAGEDRGIAVADVDAFADAVKKAGGRIAIHVYKGRGHAFINPNNKAGYDEKDANDAWAKTWDFLAANLAK